LREAKFDLARDRTSGLVARAIVAMLATVHTLPVLTESIRAGSGIRVREHDDAFRQLDLVIIV